MHLGCGWSREGTLTHTGMPEDGWPLPSLSLPFRHRRTTPHQAGPVLAAGTSDHRQLLPQDLSGHVLPRQLLGASRTPSFPAVLTERPEGGTSDSHQTGGLGSKCVHGG